MFFILQELHSFAAPAQAPVFFVGAVPALVFFFQVAPAPQHKNI